MPKVFLITQTTFILKHSFWIIIIVVIVPIAVFEEGRTLEICYRKCTVQTKGKIVLLFFKYILNKNNIVLQQF